MQVFDTPEAIDVFRLSTFKAAIKLMLRGIKPNRSYTWKNVARTVGGMLGKQYRGKADAQAMLRDIETVLKGAM